MSLWDFRGLGRSNALRSVANSFFRVVFSNGRIHKIRRGPLKGLKWYCYKDHQFWMPLGVYEKETTLWLKENMNSETVFYDIGANAGYFTLLGSLNAAKTYAFEPVPVNIEVIEQHLSENEISNVQVVPVALTNQVGILPFIIEGKNANSHLEDIAMSHAIPSNQEVLNVTSTTLDDFIKKNHPPTLLKIDVEGAELRVLEGASQCLSEYKPQIILSTHSESLKEDCRIFLLDHGYSVYELPGFEHELITSFRGNS